MFVWVDFPSLSVIPSNVRAAPLSLLRLCSFPKDSHVRARLVYLPWQTTTNSSSSVP
jgi:hypothetical protein